MNTKKYINNKVSSKSFRVHLLYLWTVTSACTFSIYAQFYNFKDLGFIGFTILAICLASSVICCWSSVLPQATISNREFSWKKICQHGHLFRLESSICHCLHLGEMFILYTKGDKSRNLLLISTCPIICIDQKPFFWV